MLHLPLGQATDNDNPVTLGKHVGSVVRETAEESYPILDADGV